MSAPTQRRAATDADWLEVSGAMYARGATDAHFAALGALDRNSPNLCPGVIMLLQTLNGIDSEGIKAVRAQYLADYAAT